MLTKLHLPQTRWGAFAGHLVISAAIFIALCALIYFCFFPGALFFVAGGVDGIKIVAGVDVVLGPLLTLVIYNVAKPRKLLYRDLVTIGTIQITALAAGMTIVYRSRPVSVSYIYDGFYTAKMSAIRNAGSEPLDSFNLLTPTIYYTELPQDNDQALEIVAQAELSEFPISTRTDLLHRFPTDEGEIRKVMRHKAAAYDTAKPECVVVDLTTAFDFAQVCFDTTTQRFKMLPKK